MGFMQKVKQILGIGGVKVKLTTSPQVARDSRLITGGIDLNSQSDQSVTKLIVQLTEHRSTGKGAEAKHQKFELGEALVTQDVEVKAGVPVHFDFQLPFTLNQSITEKMQNKGGVMGVMGKLGAMAENERIKYTVSAHASVKGRMLAASGSMDVVMV